MNNSRAKDLSIELLKIYHKNNNNNNKWVRFRKVQTQNWENRERFVHLKLFIKLEEKIRKRSHKGI